MLLRNPAHAGQDNGLEDVGALKRLPLLTHLDLAQNRLTSLLPASGRIIWDALTNLKLLSIEGNSITALPGRNLQNNLPHSENL